MLKILIVIFFAISLCFSNLSFATPNPQVLHLEQQINMLQSQIQQLEESSTDQNNLQVMTDYIIPDDTNFAYNLLQERDTFQSVFSLGGEIEADIQAFNSSDNLKGLHLTSDQGSDLALTLAKIYSVFNINAWTQGFMAITAGLNDNPTTLSAAFVNFGNLSKNPFYLTLGKAYPPFGIFTAGNGPWSMGLLDNAFFIPEINQLAFGFSKGDLNTTFAVFNSQNNAGDFIYNFKYHQDFQNFSLSGGASYLNDIRYTDSSLGFAYAIDGSMPSEGYPLSGGRNGAIDLSTDFIYNLNHDQFLDLNAEWVTTTTSAFYNNTATGKMRGWGIAEAYTLPVFNKMTAFGLGYTATLNMQNVPLLMPAGPANTNGEIIIGAKYQWVVYADSELLQNIFVGPEFTHTQLYDGQHTWESTLDMTAYF